MKNKLIPLLVILMMQLTACDTIIPAATASATRPPLPEASTSTPIPPSPTATSIADPIMEAVRPIPGTIALDFVALACSAAWSSSIVFIPCQGDPNALTDGYITPLKQAEIETGEIYDLPALLTIPPQGENIQGGIFGRYPPFTVKQGDRFRAVLACQPGNECGEVEYALDYYAADGSYHPFPSNQPNPFKEFAESDRLLGFIDIPLNFLAGQTIDFILVVRDQSSTLGDRYLWVAPHIYRDPGATNSTSLPPIGSGSTGSSATQPADDGDSPGVISGYVDMRSAPPYLTDPVTTLGLGVPVVVMFFNLDDGSWWWMHTTLTHPNYQMTVPPGEYYVVAYAMGVANLPYVTGVYTGGEESCGQPLAAIEVGSNETVSGIIITDWCEFTDRPLKPDEVPLP